ncbi:presequence protease, mitochondrial-like [Dermacentor silvarum]|uniref:presequence protease, mitochondrial-like n=1 Tax=Dermacentor silvarum TaxID=543639 RepID=UPI00189BE3C2|nr:presequence protease, mitochondrial-like [Dermacentor silvarum]
MFKRLCPSFKRLQARTNAHRWSHTAAVKKALQYKAGDTIGGYTVRQVEAVKELHLAAVRLLHEKTGADFLHIAREDRNNHFSVAFATLPTNSTGVPHILEHLTLCGSQKYPCRDPFMKMHNRSLATFMNAMTGCDVTFYPFSTQNIKDYENLLRVYLDAVFFPQLTKLDFMQEGWRLEHTDPKDKSSPIVIKGVVYNEMKGVFSNSSNDFNQAIVNKLCPSGVYGHVSGGHPLSIPDLTWEQLKEFHDKHYHPSNARFLTYGDFPMEKTLSLIDELALSKFEKIDSSHVIPPEPRWKEPRMETMTCVPDPLAANPEKQSTVAVTYAMNDITDTQESFAMSILSHLLVNGPNSPFYKNLLQAGIGADYTPSLGYDANLKEAFFSVGLHGVSKADINKVTDIINQTFDEVISTGFSQERIDAALHSVELNLKHQTSNFGLLLNYATVGMWNHGGDPIRSLKVNEHISWLREQLANKPRFFQEKVQQYFKENKHCLTLVMNPDDHHEEKIRTLEQKNIDRKLGELDSTSRASIYDNGLNLLQHQSKKEDESCLPHLLLGDVAPTIEMTKLNHINMGGVNVQTTEQATNGVTYFRAVLNASHLPPELKRMVPLLCEVVTKMGTQDKDYRQFLQEAELKTGGLHTSVHISPHPSEHGRFEQGVLLSSHCLEKNTEAMFSLWKELILRLKLEDDERLMQLVQMCAAGLAQTLADSGHHYAMAQAESYLNACAQLQEEFTGISHITQMKTLAEAPSLKYLLPQLKALADALLKKDSIRCSLNASSTGLSAAENSLDGLLSSIPGVCTTNCPDYIADADFYAKERKIHMVFPFGVNYCAKSFNAVPYGHPDYSSATDGSSVLDKMQMAYYFMECNFTHIDLAKKALQRKSILCDCRAALICKNTVDKPITPGNRGAAAFLHGVTDEMRQEHRQRIFACSKDDIISAVKRCAGESGCTSSVAVIGPENKFTETGKHWLVHRDGSKKPGEEVQDGKEAGQLTKESAAHSRRGTSFSRNDSSSSDSDSDSGSSESDSDEDTERFLLKVHGLPRDVTPALVAKHLMRAGIKVSKGAQGVLLLTRNNLSSGSAFIQVTSKEDQERAVSYAWGSAQLSGRGINVIRAKADDVRRYVMTRPPPPSALKDIVSSRVVHVRNLVAETTEEQLKEFLSHCNVTRIERERFDSNKAQRSAFVRFMTTEDAQRALAMTGKRLKGMKLELRLISEDYADRLLKGDLLSLALYDDNTSSRMRARRSPTTTQKKAKASGGRWIPDEVVKEHDLEEVLQSSEGQHKVVAEGLPFSVAQIGNFLWPLKPTMVVHVRRTDGALSAKTVLSFANLADAQEAAKKNGHVIFGRIVKMTLVTSGMPSGRDDGEATKTTAASSS